jgi:hypothetical protein
VLTTFPNELDLGVPMAFQVKCTTMLLKKNRNKIKGNMKVDDSKNQQNDKDLMKN